LADVVGPPKTGCPFGSKGTSSHAGAYCKPEAACKEGGSCTKGTCQEVSLCIEKKELSGRPGPNGKTEKYPYEEVHGTCSAGGTCAKGTCTTVKRCVEGSPPLCGCQVSDEDSARGWLLVFMAIASLLFLQRKSAAQSV